LSRAPDLGDHFGKPIGLGQEGCIVQDAIAVASAGFPGGEDDFQARLLCISIEC
jgi:hypothetical protein